MYPLIAIDPEGIMTSNNTTPTDKGFATPTASWFKSTITLEEIPKPALDLLMSRTGLPLDKVVPHVNEAVSATFFYLLATKIVTYTQNLTTQSATKLGEQRNSF